MLTIYLLYLYTLLFDFTSPNAYIWRQLYSYEFSMNSLMRIYKRACSYFFIYSHFRFSFLNQRFGGFLVLPFLVLIFVRESFGGRHLHKFHHLLMRDRRWF